MNEFTGSITRRKENGLLLNQAFRDLLKSNGLLDFDAIYRFKGGQIVKKISNRTIVRIELYAPEKHILYLKRHVPERISAFISPSFLDFSGTPSQGRLEFENICDFRQNSIPTVTPVACGEHRIHSNRVESFVLTEDFHPWISLEEMIRDQPGFFKGHEGEGRKKVLLDKLGQLAKKMHRSGFNHRDFNATHILLRYTEDGELHEPALFDLQRVDRKRIFRFRWIIKALAELNYSLPENLFTPKDRLRLFQAYHGKPSLSVWNQFQYLWVQKKTGRISRHTDHMMAKRAERRRLGLPER
ncbi:MAG: lipopolysaccharide kinase InaA family protein [Thermodesulfobacteriota bacterium]